MDTSGSTAWHRTFRIMLGSAPAPLMRALSRNLTRVPYVDLTIVGRRTGQERHVMVTLLEIDGNWYVGHPNGRSQWVRNLEAAGSAKVHSRARHATVAPVPLSSGPERDAVVNATSRQPFPANLVYRAGREHVRAVGSYFRLEPLSTIS